jgi:GNAT superfamily N-acetyltransferase
MPVSVRAAIPKDAAYIAAAMVKIPAHISRLDPYVAGLPKKVNQVEMEYAQFCIEAPNSIVLVAQDDEKTLGCLVGELRETSMPPSGLGEVGYIDVIWVEPDSRGSGVATALVAHAERWFDSKGVDTIELAYLAANELAATAWSKLGYKPFRVFAFKSIR